MCSISVQAVDLFWREEIEDNTDRKHESIHTQHVDIRIVHGLLFIPTKIKIIHPDSLSLLKIRASTS